MSSSFPQVDRNRLISQASKQLLGLQMPASWHEVQIGGDTDFGFDLLVHVAVDGGVQRAFLIQLKGTESPRYIADGETLSYPLKDRTLNLYATVGCQVMLVVAAVKLDASGKLDVAASKIYWQWMSAELRDKRGGAFELGESDGTTSVHLPTRQVLSPDLDVLPHLESVGDIVRAGLTLEDILQRSQALVHAGRRPFILQLAEIASHKPNALTALLQSGHDHLSADLPPEAHAIRALIRAGRTELAETELARLGPQGLGPSASQQAALLSLRGKTLVQRFRRSEAIELFEQAYALDPLPEHLLPLAEMRLLRAIDDGDRAGVAAVRDMLSDADSDDGLSLRVRVHGFLNEFAQAQACLDRISPTEQWMPRTVLMSAQCRWQDAIDTVTAAEADGNLSAAALTSVQLVGARAAWCGATQGVEPLMDGSQLPLSGAVGTKLDLARQAWVLALKCLKALQTLGWSANTEVLASTVCGVAPLLGRQDEALALMSEAAAHRPEYPELQLNTELLAVMAHKPEQALAANLRQPQGMDVLTRRALLLFELQRFSECQDTALTIARSAEAPNDKTPMALAMGWAAAHRLGHLVAATELNQAIDARPAWMEHRYFADFVRQTTLQPSGDSPLDALRAGLAQHPDSWMLAANLFLNLAVSDAAAAAEAVGLARILRRNALLKADEAARLVAAHITLGNWQEAAGEAADALQRFEADDRLLGMAAIAQEMLGRTGAAFALLEKALALGTQRLPAIHNYMGLSLRLGRVDAVRAALDKLLALVTDPVERIELMRLSTLVYLQQEQPREALAAVEALGQLVDPSDEEQEGLFINAFMAATVGGSVPSQSLHTQVQQRIEAFCAKWPESKLFRLATLPDENDVFNVHDLLDPLIGDSRAQLREFESRERRASRGEFPVPFILRPGFVLHYIGSPFQLWEAAMHARAEAQQFHLNIVLQGEEAKSADPTREVPILDLTALLVLDSLGLFDQLFEVFRRVAIPRATVAFVSHHALGVLASGASAKRAKSILARINHWVDRIDQPSAGLKSKEAAVSAMDVWCEYSALAQRATWLNYCDDVVCRAMIQAHAPAARACTTIDFLDLLDMGDVLAEQEISAKLALLATWNVGIKVSDRFLIASLVDAWPDGEIGDASRRADAFREHPLFSTLARAIWNPGKSVPDLTNDMVHLLCAMLIHPGSNADSAAAVLANWFTRVRLLKQADGLGWRLLCYPVLMAIKAMPDEACSRLVNVLMRAVSASVPEHAMSVAVEGEVTEALGRILGSVGKKDRSIADDLLKKLHAAMPVGTVDGDRLTAAYLAEVRR